MTSNRSNDARAYSSIFKRFGEGATSDLSDFPSERLPKEGVNNGGLDANVLGECWRVGLDRSEIGLTVVVDGCGLEVSACDGASCWVSSCDGGV